MRLHVLGCAGGSAPSKRLTSLLIDDVLAVDAGALTTALEIPAQREVRAVVLTHGHLDHIWTLPLFLANRFGGEASTCRVFASAYTLETVSEHVLNNRVWPDFTRAATQTGPLMRLTPAEPPEPFTVLGNYELTPVPLNHTVPCQGYLVRRDASSFLVGADTGINDELWRVANETEGLGGMIVECSFPNDMAALARSSGHLTPAMLGDELKKLDVDVPVYITHMKPGYEASLVRQLAALKDRRIRPLLQGQTIEVS